MSCSKHLFDPKSIWIETDSSISDDNLKIDDPTLLSCATFTDPNGGRHVEICVRVVDAETVAEEIAYNDKKRRSILMGTSAVLFLHLDEDEEDSGAEERLLTMVIAVVLKMDRSLLYSH